MRKRRKMSSVLLLYTWMLWHVLSAEAGPIRFCGKADFQEAYYDGPVVAAPEGTVLTLTCKRAYKPGYATTKCKDSQWMDPTPPCELVNCRRQDLMTPHVLIENSCLGVECVANLTCIEGYWYDGPKTRTCQQNGTWSGPSVSCETEPCPHLEGIDNGVLSSTTGNFTDSVKLRCNDGYTLNGDDRIYCMAGGKWSAKLGICKGQKNLVGIWILVSLLVVGLLVAFVAFFRFRRVRSTEQAITRPPKHDTNIPLLAKGSELYVHLNVTHGFGCEYGDESSSQYAVVKSLIEEKVLDAMKHTQVNRIDVLSLRKPDKIYLCIISKEPIDRTDVGSALKQVNIPCNLEGRDVYKVVPTSLIFDVTKGIKLQILKGKHIRDHNMDYQIDLDLQYEELGIIRRNRPSFTHSDCGEDISDVDILGDDAPKRVILILGRAGVGKSTLLQCLARKWANGIWNAHLKAIFLLNLRYLMSDKTQMTFASLLCMRPTYVNKDNMLNIGEEWLEENQEDIAVMLDGLDEIGKVKDLWKKYGNVNSDNTPLDWCFRLLKREKLSKCTLLVSSRSSEDVQSLLNPNDTVEVIGLSSRKIASFIRKNVREEQRKRVNESLKGNPILMSISSITFYCATLCKLLQNDDTPAVMLNTYTRITACLLEMYICRSLKDGHTIDDVYDEMKMSLQSMAQLAYNGLTESRSVLNFKECYTEKDLEDAGINVNNMLKLQNAGLLLRNEITDTEDPHKYSIYGQFVHLSIQEYMTMANLLTQDQEESRKTLDSLLPASSQFNMALLYLVGLAFNEEESAVSRTSLAIGNQSGENLDIKEALIRAAVNVSDDVLAIQMVHESQSKEFASEVGEQRFGDGLTLEKAKLTLFEVKGLTFLLENCPSITRIELKYVGLDPSSIEEVSKHLSESKSIRELSFLDTTINGNAIKEILQEVKENKHLEKLELSFGRNIGDDIMNHVADALSVNTSLKDLWLVGGTLRSAGAGALLSAMQSGNRDVRIRMHKHTCDESTREAIEPFIHSGRLTFEEETEGREQSIP